MHDIYKRLTQGDDLENVSVSNLKDISKGNALEDKPFRNMKDLFMWAVSMGYQKGEQRSLTKKQGIFRYSTFTEKDTALLKAIAIAATEEVEILIRPDEFLTIAEEYANAGIHVLENLLLQEKGQPLVNLLAILDK